MSYTYHHPIRQAHMDSDDSRYPSSGFGGSFFSSAPKIPPNEDLSLADNPRMRRYPFSLVWGTLPVISWCFPCIGHLGITDSNGRVHDFQAPYTVITDSFMTGPVLKTFRFSPEQIRALAAVSNSAAAAAAGNASGGTTRALAILSPGAAWDRAVDESDEKYAQMVHNICCNNCHHHSAEALANAGLPMTMLGAWWLMISHGKYTSCGAVVATYCPFAFLVLVAVGLAVGLSTGL